MQIQNMTQTCKIKHFNLILLTNVFAVDLQWFYLTTLSSKNDLKWLLLIKGFYIYQKETFLF